MPAIAMDLHHYHHRTLRPFLKRAEADTIIQQQQHRMRYNHRHQHHHSISYFRQSQHISSSLSPSLLSQQHRSLAFCGHLANKIDMRGRQDIGQQRQVVNRITGQNDSAFSIKRINNFAKCSNSNNGLAVGTVKSEEETKLESHRYKLGESISTALMERPSHQLHVVSYYDNGEEIQQHSPGHRSVSRSVGFKLASGDATESVMSNKDDRRRDVEGEIEEVIDYVTDPESGADRQRRHSRTLTTTERRRSQQNGVSLVLQTTSCAVEELVSTKELLSELLQHLKVDEKKTLASTLQDKSNSPMIMASTSSSSLSSNSDTTAITSDASENSKASTTSSGRISERNYFMEGSFLPRGGVNDYGSNIFTKNNRRYSSSSSASSSSSTSLKGNSSPTALPQPRQCIKALNNFPTSFSAPRTRDYSKYGPLTRTGACNNGSLLLNYHLRRSADPRSIILVAKYL